MAKDDGGCASSIGWLIAFCIFGMPILGSCGGGSSGMYGGIFGGLLALFGFGVIIWIFFCWLGNK